MSLPPFFTPPAPVPRAPHPSPGLRAHPSAGAPAPAGLLPPEGGPPAAHPDARLPGAGSAGAAHGRGALPHAASGHACLDALPPRDPAATAAQTSGGDGSSGLVGRIHALTAEVQQAHLDHYRDELHRCHAAARFEDAWAVFLYLHRRAPGWGLALDADLYAQAAICTGPAHTDEVLALGVQAGCLRPGLGWNAEGGILDLRPEAVLAGPRRPGFAAQTALSLPLTCALVCHHARRGRLLAGTPIGLPATADPGCEAAAYRTLREMGWPFAPGAPLPAAARFQPPPPSAVPAPPPGFLFFDEAPQLLSLTDRMARRPEPPPNADTLQAFVRGQCSEAQLWVDTQNRIRQHARDVWHAACCLAGALRLRHPQTGATLVPPEACFHEALSVCRRMQHWLMALALLNTMRCHQVAPTVRCYRQGLLACKIAKRPIEAWHLVQQMLHAEAADAVDPATFALAAGACGEPAEACLLATGIQRELLRPALGLDARRQRLSFEEQDIYGETSPPPPAGSPVHPEMLPVLLRHHRRAGHLHPGLELHCGAAASIGLQRRVVELAHEFGLQAPPLREPAKDRRAGAGREATDTAQAGQAAAEPAPAPEEA